MHHPDFDFARRLATIADALFSIQEQLAPVADELALVEAETIIGHLLRLSRSELYCQRSRCLSDADNAGIRATLRQRLRGMPLAYALQSVYFFSQDYFINQAVLIPRPDTETLVQTILALEPEPANRFADVGTGSGIIAQSLVSVKSGWKATAIDISPAACCVARRNCAASIGIVCCDKLDSLKQSIPFDFIVSNPPYISADEMQTLDSSVREWEPEVALAGGIDGCDFYRYLADNAGDYLCTAGRIYAEIGWQQADLVRQIFNTPAWRDFRLTHDCAGRNRVIRVVYNGASA
jgi:release factor glutamine methyltransferase